jgi:hypothetical protein
MMPEASQTAILADFSALRANDAANLLAERPGPQHHRTAGVHVSSKCLLALQISAQRRSSKELLMNAGTSTAR